ncbi:MAG: hypothetical protein U0795_06415 [Pirellulales bacterium]
MAPPTLGGLPVVGEATDATTRQIRSAVEAQADQLGMEVRYLRSPVINKEAYVQDILAERGRDPGFVAILSCVEPCRSYQIRRNHQTKQLDLEYTQRQCLHYYHYFLDDKFGLVLRVETTINQPAQMKVYRAKEGDSGGPKSWRQMRKGVADSHRRAHISQKANERYLDGLAQMELDTPLGKLLEPVTQRTTFHGGSVRALRPFDQDDHALLRAISQGQFALQGFRNADIRGILNISPGDSDPQARKRQAAAMTRRFRLLRAHGIIQKIHATHRYQLTDFGRALTAAVISAHRASVQKLTSAA